MGRRESPQLIERKTQVDADAQETSRASKYLFAFVSSAGWNGQPNVGFAYPGKIFACAHACVICVYNLTSALYFAIWPFFCYSRTLCSSLSVSVSLNVRFTTNGVCSKTYNQIYVARTNEDLSPYICNVCEFSETNFCMPTWWLTGSLQKIPPWLQPLVT